MNLFFFRVLAGKKMAVPEIADDQKSLKKEVIGKKIPPPFPPNLISIYLTK